MQCLMCFWCMWLREVVVSWQQVPRFLSLLRDQPPSRGWRQRGWHLDGLSSGLYLVCCSSTLTSCHSTLASIHCRNVCGCVGWGLGWAEHFFPLYV